MDYIRRLKKVLKSKPNGQNITNAVNSRAVSTIRDSAGTVERKINESRKENPKAADHVQLVPQEGDMDRLYIRRLEGGRGLTSVEDCVLVENCP